MVLKIYNTMSRKLEEFKPMSGKKVKMFVCGLTVYDDAHVGHAKSYIGYDIIAKYLRYSGYDVKYLQNVTDIDDKIIQRANEKKKKWSEISEEFTNSYIDDMKALNVTAVDKYIKATDYVPQIIEQAEKLVKSGYAYESAGNVYFSIAKFKEYGKLSHRDPDEMLAMSRLEEDPYKREPFDFVIWKKSKPGEPVWDSPWGDGRPGWHIEDTAISVGNFGPQYDIHGGGEDLIFPHHEAEIAIAEAYTGKKPFVKYWIHNAFITVNGKKMSKSLKNFVTIKEALARHSAKALRFYFATTLFNKPIDYTDENVKNAPKELEKIQNTLDNLRFLLEKSGAVGSEGGIEIEKYRSKFIKAMDNNFNTADASAVVFEFVREINKLVSEKKLSSRKNIESALALFKEWGAILGVDFAPGKEQKAPAEVLTFVEAREEARKKKDFKKSDELRSLIRTLGYTVTDTAQGPKVEKM
ncbi:MAG: cysteine--tRNA ligase [Candidatus Micrarchaeota archaeon]